MRDESGSAEGGSPLPGCGVSPPNLFFLGWGSHKEGNYRHNGPVYTNSLPKTGGFVLYFGGRKKICFIPTVAGVLPDLSVSELLHGSATGMIYNWFGQRR